MVVHADAQRISPLPISEHAPPPVWQTSCGRQEQVGVAGHAAGFVMQRGGGGVQGGASQPRTPLCGQSSRKVQPVGHSPPSARGWQSGAGPPQLERTQSSLLPQTVPPQSGPPPLPAAPASTGLPAPPAAPVIPPAPPFPAIPLAPPVPSGSPPTEAQAPVKSALATTRSSTEEGRDTWVRA